MAPTPSAPPRVSFAEGLMQVFDVLGDVAGIAWDVGETASVRASVTVSVDSEAEVDGAAAVLGAIPERPAAGHYQAARREGAVTVTVKFCAACTAAGSTP